MTAIPEVRTHLASVLDAAMPIPVHTYPPAALNPPCLVLLPGSPYLDPYGLAASRVGLVARLVVTAASGPDAQRSFDDLLHTAITALQTAGVVVEPIPAPTPDSDAGVLSGDIPTTTVWHE